MYGVVETRIAMSSARTRTVSQRSYRSCIVTKRQGRHARSSSRCVVVSLLHRRRRTPLSVRRRHPRRALAPCARVVARESIRRGRSISCMTCRRRSVHAGIALRWWCAVRLAGVRVVGRRRLPAGRLLALARRVLLELALHLLATARDRECGWRAGE